ncbi:MAG: winged helix-turn-helix domain-containing protein, partial [Acidobacteria bacterium]|nr:winged helix-turn-helix domain-containing protein [Acidobacteriota bacterium]
MHSGESKAAGFSADFCIGAWLVEPSLDRVSQNGTVLRLRPQLVDLLVVLAQHAGRTVSKETILASVWAGQHVAESGMTRCIAEIRQALGDDAHEPTMIQTIPKRGYRLVAPVVFLEASPAPGAGGDTAPPPVSTEPIDPARGSDVPGQGPLRVPLRIRWTVGSILGGAALLAVTLGAIGWSRVPVLSARDTVLLADVTNTTGDPSFDGTLKLALAVHLGQAPFLHILSDDHVRTALTLTGRPASQAVAGPVALEVCRREGAAVLLAGSIARMGSHYAVGLEAIACNSGDSIAREFLDVESKEGVLTGLETAAARLRRKLGESRASLSRYDVPIVRATTPSLEALRALSLGDLNRDHARLGDALAFYRRATELDPEFALAWARRGAAAGNLGLPEEATPAFRKAYDLRDRVSEAERFYILGHYYRFVADDPDKAVET